MPDLDGDYDDFEVPGALSAGVSTFTLLDEFDVLKETVRSVITHHEGDEKAVHGSHEATA